MYQYLMNTNLQIAKTHEILLLHAFSYFHGQQLHFDYGDCGCVFYRPFQISISNSRIIDKINILKIIFDFISTRRIIMIWLIPVEHSRE